jgi:hypothetical protein
MVARLIKGRGNSKIDPNPSNDLSKICDIYDPGSAAALVFNRFQAIEAIIQILREKTVLVGPS